MSSVSSPRALRPDEIRRQDFTVRFRGLDPNEVRGFLNALADDLARLHEQVTALTEDNGRVGGELQHARGELQHAQTELQRAQADPREQVTEQAVLVLDQAQQLADALIDEGMQSARDLLMAARHQQRDIVDLGREADHETVVQAAARPDHLVRQNASSSSDVEDVRMFANVAQAQFRAVLDALDAQVTRLGQFSDTADGPKLADDHELLPAAEQGSSVPNQRTVR